MLKTYIRDEMAPARAARDPVGRGPGAGRGDVAGRVVRAERLRRAAAARSSRPRRDGRGARRSLARRGRQSAGVRSIRYEQQRSPDAMWRLADDVGAEDLAEQVQLGLAGRRRAPWRRGRSRSCARAGGSCRRRRRRPRRGSPARPGSRRARGPGRRAARPAATRSASWSRTRSPSWRRRAAKTSSTSSSPPIAPIAASRPGARAS